MTSMLAAWTAFSLAALGGVSPVPADGAVTGLQILPSAERTEVVISLEGSVEVRDFTMEGPHRIVVDLLGARYRLDQGSFGDVARGGIRTVRASQFTEDVVRVVLELELALGYTLLTGDGYVRLSLENPIGDDFDAWRVDAAPGPAPADQGVSDPFTTAANPGADSAPPRSPAARSGRWRGIQSQEFARRISVSFVNTPIREVLFTFADFTNRSIVPGADVSGTVNAEIRDQPWDIALMSILESHDLAAQEQASGIIRVDRMEDLNRREEVEQLVTRSFRVNYASAAELEASVESLLSDRGRTTVSASTNSLVVTDVARVLESVEELIEGLDLQTPEITISAKIIFVARTDLEEFGVMYDLKDSRGNQLNVLAPGVLDGERVDIGTNVFSLGGNSIAALGNANQRITSPSLQFLTSLILGRHTLIGFVEALSERQLSEIQAAPQTRVLDNQLAKILVGERTPIRVVDAAAVGEFAQANVEIVETGIVLEVTPHVTAGDLILLDLRAERSGIGPAPADLGFTFDTQEVETRVLVADGETVVIGGLTVTERTELHQGIPLLQNLPLLGRFFRVSSERREQRDLMILVTPQINRR